MYKTHNYTLNYCTIESSNIATPQATWLQETEKIPNKPPAKLTKQLQFTNTQKLQGTL